MWVLPVFLGVAELNHTALLERRKIGKLFCLLGCAETLFLLCFRSKKTVTFTRVREGACFDLPFLSPSSHWRKAVVAERCHSYSLRSTSVSQLHFCTAGFTAAPEIHLKAVLLLLLTDFRFLTEDRPPSIRSRNLLPSAWV